VEPSFKLPISFIKLNRIGAQFQLFVPLFTLSIKYGIIIKELAGDFELFNEPWVSVEKPVKIENSITEFVIFTDVTNVFIFIGCELRSQFLFWLIYKFVRNRNADFLYSCNHKTFVWVDFCTNNDFKRF
jgi:predicted cation transporter